MFSLAYSYNIFRSLACISIVCIKYLQIVIPILGSSILISASFINSCPHLSQSFSHSNVYNHWNIYETCVCPPLLSLPLTCSISALLRIDSVHLAGFFLFSFNFHFRLLCATFDRCIGFSQFVRISLISLLLLLLCYV